MTNVLELLDAIVSSNEIDAGSMQVYDAIALVAKQDKQIRSLCTYIAETMPIQMIIESTYSHSFTYFIGDKAYANVDVVFDISNSVAASKIVISLIDRWPMFATAYHIASDNVKVAMTTVIKDNTITITGMTTSKVYVQFI